MTLKNKSIALWEQPRFLSDVRERVDLFANFSAANPDPPDRVKRIRKAPSL